MKGTKIVKHGVRWLRSRGKARGLILLYHRVATALRDPYDLCVSPTNFETQMYLLHEVCTPISLEEMLLAAKGGNLPPHAVAVTFDDGYADNCTDALPILERYNIPATFFVVAGTLGQQFWWEVVQQAIYKPKVLSSELTLTIKGLTYHWQVQNTEAGRIFLLRDLHQRLRPLDNTERGPILAEIQDWASVDPTSGNETRSLTETELAELANSEQITIGAHTVNHPPLSLLSPIQQQQEILNSKARLEAIIGQAVMTFSYPYGMPSDYTAETVRLVQQAGFRCACTNNVDVVQASSDHYHLPRYWIRDWSAVEFKKRLLHWL